MHFLFRVGCRAFEKFYFTLLYFSRQTIDSPGKVDYDSCLAAVYLKPFNRNINTSGSSFLFIYPV